jgi:hypothetical protein
MMVVVVGVVGRQRIEDQPLQRRSALAERIQ